jgi:hypothetical protein
LHWEKDVGTPRKWLKISWEGSKIQRLKFDNIFFTDESLVDKENLFEKEKSKIRCLWTRLNFI